MSSSIEDLSDPMREVTFIYRNDRAVRVDLVGSFNDWRLGSTPLKKMRNGLWIVKLKCPTGSYPYMFVVDGNSWLPDPEAARKVSDGFGRTNSLLVIE